MTIIERYWPPIPENFRWCRVTLWMWSLMFGWPGILAVQGWLKNLEANNLRIADRKRLFSLSIAIPPVRTSNMRPISRNAAFLPAKTISRYMISMPASELTWPLMRDLRYPDQHLFPPIPMPMFWGPSGLSARVWVIVISQLPGRADLFGLRFPNR